MLLFSVTVAGFWGKVDGRKPQLTIHCVISPRRCFKWNPSLLDYCNRYAIRRRQWGARKFKTFCFFHGSVAEDAGNARDATTQRTGTDPIFASKISRLSDTQN